MPQRAETAAARGCPTRDGRTWRRARAPCRAGMGGARPQSSGQRATERIGGQSARGDWRKHQIRGWPPRCRRRGDSTAGTLEHLVAEQRRRVGEGEPDREAWRQLRTARCYTGSMTAGSARGEVSSVEGRPPPRTPRSGNASRRPRAPIPDRPRAAAGAVPHRVPHPPRRGGAGGHRRPRGVHVTLASRWLDPAGPEP